MKILFIVLSLLAVGCSDFDPQLPEPTDNGEPPFFSADRKASGPLTLDELDINIPAEIDVTLNDSTRACFFAAVERRAGEAGKPSELDPDDFPYWGGEVDRKEWQEHSNYMQRILLAQAVISWAMSDC